MAMANSLPVQVAAAMKVPVRMRLRGAFEARG